MFADTKTQSADIQSKQAFTLTLEAEYFRLGGIRQSFVSLIGDKINRGEITAREVYECKVGLNSADIAIHAEAKPTMVPQKSEKAIASPTNIPEVVSATPPPQYKSNHKHVNLAALEKRSSLAQFALGKVWT